MIKEITAIVTAIATSLTVILLFFRKEKDFLEKCKKEIKDIKNSSKETRNFF
jgi:formiminotetrahydrofolate cyclodeaminase